MPRFFPPELLRVKRESRAENFRPLDKGMFLSKKEIQNNPDRRGKLNVFRPLDYKCDSRLGVDLL